MLKSFRESFRKKKTQEAGQVFELTSSTTQLVEAGRGAYHEDESAVRNGICNFQVKYLGSIEVPQSRGVEVCDEAFKLLKANKKTSMKAVFYISGDGLRVVDEKTRGLIVDQTVEKVSFCAPVSSFERGFCYICRDGTTQRWMCYGFVAKKEKGDRLCQAVGVAFTICAERKKKRQEDCLLVFSPDVSNSNRLDNQTKHSTPNELQNILTSPSSRTHALQFGPGSPFAVARPRNNDLMFQRQSSFMGLGHQSPVNSPFRRQMSLRVEELPSSVTRQKNSGLQFRNPPELELKRLDDNPESAQEESADAVSTFRPLPPLPTYRLSKPLAEIQNGGDNLNKNHRGSLVLCDVPSTIPLDIQNTGNPFTPNFLAQASGPTKTPLLPSRQTDKFDFSDFQCQVFQVRQESPPPPETVPGDFEKEPVKSDDDCASKNPFQSDMSPCPESEDKPASTNPFFGDGYDGDDTEEIV